MRVSYKDLCDYLERHGCEPQDGLVNGFKTWVSEDGVVIQLVPNKAVECSDVEMIVCELLRKHPHDVDYLVR